MELKEIVSVKGRGGLFRVLKTTNSGLVIRPLGDAGRGVLAIPEYGVTLLSEISIYTHGKEEMVSLKAVMEHIWKKFGDKLSITPNADQKDLVAFMQLVLPNYNEKRVYASDIKKLVKWYPLLLEHAREAIVTEAEKTEAAKDSSVSPQKDTANKKKSVKATKASPKKGGRKSRNNLGKATS